MIIKVEMRNRFKGLDLKNRVLEELWMKVVTLYRTEIKTIPMEKKCKKENWLSEEGL